MPYSEPLCLTIFSTWVFAWDSTLFWKIYHTDIQEPSSARFCLQVKTSNCLNLTPTDAHAGLDFTITDDILPVLQVYRNGKLVEQLENLGEELRSGFDIDDVDDFLQEKGVLDKSDAVID